MKRTSKFLIALLLPFSFASAGTFDAAVVEKLNRAVRECNAPGMEPKPGMSEFTKFLESRGFKGVKIECGVSHFADATPFLLLRLLDGSEVFVNYKKTKSGAVVSEIVEDVATPEGNKRKVVWPVVKAKNEKGKK